MTLLLGMLLAYGIVRLGWALLVMVVRLPRAVRAVRAARREGASPAQVTRAARLAFGGRS